MQDFAEFLSDLKDQFYFCKNVTESIFRAAERVHGSLRKKLEEICFLLEEEDMGNVMSAEWSHGNGKFLRVFQVQCRSAVQYGSGKNGTESTFVRNMTELRRDVQEECYQRLEGMYLFSGMGVVTVLPMVFLPFIRWFGNITMEELAAFYEGRLGQAMVVVFVVITVVCYLLLLLIRQPDKRVYRRPEVIQRLFLHKNRCCGMPMRQGSAFERRGEQRLSDAGIEGNGTQYWSVCIFCGIVLAVFSVIVFPAVSVSARILLFFCGAVIGMAGGMGFYKYLGYLRRLGMRGEVLGLQATILLLTDVPNITVMGILDVLGDCGELFQKQLLRCANEYVSEDVGALERLFYNAEHPAFRELTARILASERIGIKTAFEEVARDRSFFREQIRLDREQEQKKKAANAQLMVFLPMVFLLFAYLIVPFLGISMRQMGDIFREMEQIRYF